MAILKKLFTDLLNSPETNLEHGRNHEKDDEIELAIKYYKKSAQGGNVYACEKLYDIYKGNENYIKKCELKKYIVNVANKNDKFKLIMSELCEDINESIEWLERSKDKKKHELLFKKYLDNKEYSSALYSLEEAIDNGYEDVKNYSKFIREKKQMKELLTEHGGLYK